MLLTGYIQTLDYSEGEALYIGREPLAEALEEFDKKNVYVCFAFDAQEITPQRLVEIAIQSAEGLVDAELGASYSEVTGFLWVDEKGMVGGHDLVEIFGQHEKQFGALVIQTEPIDLTLLAAAPSVAPGVESGVEECPECGSPRLEKMHNGEDHHCKNCRAEFSAAAPSAAPGVEAG